MGKSPRLRLLNLASSWSLTMRPHKRDLPQGYIVGRHGLVCPDVAAIRRMKDHAFREIRRYTMGFKSHGPGGPIIHRGYRALIGKKKRPWQDRAVLGYFGRTVGQAKKAYLNFMEEGITRGRREDLTGGGLIRSVGGWAEVKQLKRQGYDADRIAKKVAEIYDMDVGTKGDVLNF